MSAARTTPSPQTGSGNPTDSGKGGLVFMHNGDNMVRYPDHGAHKQCLVCDICLELATRGGVMMNR